MEGFYRQGDFAFIPVQECPRGKQVRRKGGRIIVGRGEVTGHHHAVTLPQVKMIEATDARRYLTSKEPFAVMHEEHNPVHLPAGVYEIRQQRQYARGEIRRVLD